MMKSVGEGRKEYGHVFFFGICTSNSQRPQGLNLVIRLAVHDRVGSRRLFPPRGEVSIRRVYWVLY
jgi:hypothetical protein